MTLGTSSGSGVGRRRFLAGAASAVAAPWFVPASVLGRRGHAAASERVTLGMIGLGIRGSAHVNTFLPLSQCRILAVSDLFKSRRDQKKTQVDRHYSGSGCDAYADFRDLLARDDIDAVVIASPEHWHGLLSVHAARAGKDIYCEKALTLTVAEGRAVVDAVKTYRRVFQIGTQQRSSRNFRFACELARNGYLGELRRVEVGVPGGHALGNAPTIQVPADLDYDRWLGPAPEKPYNAIRCTSPEGWYHIYDYCAGWIQSWGVHHVDIALWGAPALLESPLRVEGSAEFPAEGLGNTSTKWDTRLVAPSGVELSFSDNSKNKQGCKFIGDKGWVHVNRGSLTAGPESLLKARLRPSEEHLYESNHHWVNFLECVKTRKDPVAPVQSGHEATVATLIADIATRVGRQLSWDWSTERFIGDDDANRMLRRPMRSPWIL